jgi:hypothetical protein
MHEFHSAKLTTLGKYSNLIQINRNSLMYTLPDNIGVVLMFAFITVGIITTFVSHTPAHSPQQLVLDCSDWFITRIHSLMTSCDVHFGYHALSQLDRQSKAPKKTHRGNRGQRKRGGVSARAKQAAEAAVEYFST